MLLPWLPSLRFLGNGGCEVTGAANVGLHLIIDGSAPPVTSWALADYVRKCANAIDMTIVLGPVSTFWPATEDHRAGAQAQCIIAESHIVAKSLAGQLSIDVFSCKAFDVTIPIELALDLLKMGHDFESTILHRVGLQSSSKPDPRLAPSGSRYQSPSPGPGRG